jgi:predicted DCC family thiol-disulfide oxidoreductase YuxK
MMETKKINIPNDKHIILFDGVCNFCNSSVRFVMKRDKKDLYRYASLQSDLGRQMTEERGIDTSEIDSTILIIPDQAYYIKSDAALQISKNLSGLYPLLNVFSIIPTSIRDFFYDIVARNRYKWFGKKEECQIPTPEERSKFLDI